MKKATHIYSLFASIVSIVTIIISSIILNIAYQNNHRNIVFPEYAYEEYVDHSEEKTFTQDGGAQLYEAETSSLGGEYEIINNVAASNDQLVSHFKKGSSINYYINSGSEDYVKLIFNLSYSSSGEKSINANFLFHLRVNSEEIDLSSIVINHSVNTYDLVEYSIGTMKTKLGQNIIEIVALDYDFQMDYMVLVSSKEKTTQENNIGEKQKVFYFNPLDSMQVFEAERMRKKGPLIIDDYTASSYLSVFFINPNSELVGFIHSTQACTTSLNLRAKGRENELELTDLCFAIGKVSYTSDKKIQHKDGYDFFVFEEVELKEGLNRIEIKNLQKQLYLDCLQLNTKINHSSICLNEKHEAESAILSGCQVEDNENVSGNQNVGYCYPESSILFQIHSLVNDQKILGLRISYAGNKTKLGEVLKITVNHQEMNLTNIQIKTTSYTDYYDLPCKEISLQKGNNDILITSLDGNYNLDYVFFFGKQDFSSRSNIVEAEHLLVFNSQIENNLTASGRKNVGFNAVSSSIKLCLDTPEDITLNLSLQMSIFGVENGLFLSDILSLKINQEEILLNDIEAFSSSSWSDFRRVFLGSIHFLSGFNTLEIVSKKECYNLDYFYFQC